MRQRRETTTRGASSSLRALLRTCGIHQTFFPFGVLCAPLYGISCSLRSEPPAEREQLPYGSVALVGLLFLLLWRLLRARDPCPGHRFRLFYPDMFELLTQRYDGTPIRQRGRKGRQSYPSH